MTGSWGDRYVGQSGYGDATEPEVGPSEGPDFEWRSAIRVAWVAAAVLGVAAWALGFAAPAEALHGVRLDLMASAVVAVGLLPNQRTRGWIVAALAATGLGTALSALPAQGHWAVIGTVVLDALQTLIAYAAIGVPAATQRVRAAASPDDEEYARYQREYQAYVDYYGHPPPDQDPMHAASGQATGVAVNHAQASDDRAAQAEIQAKYAASQAYSAQTPASRRNVEAPRASADPGLPGAGQAGRASDAGVARPPREVRRPPGS